MQSSTAVSIPNRELDAFPQRTFRRLTVYSFPGAFARTEANIAFDSQNKLTPYKSQSSDQPHGRGFVDCADLL